MKKTFSKIVACLFVIGVLFVSTPFLINTKAMSIDQTVFDLGTVSGTSGTFTWSYNVKYEPLGEDYSYAYAYHLRFLVVSSNGWNEGNEDSDFAGKYYYNFNNSKVYEFSSSNMSATYHFYDISYDGDYMQMDMYIRDMFSTSQSKSLYRFAWNFTNSDSDDSNVFTFDRTIIVNNESAFIVNFTDGYEQGEDAGYIVGYQQGQTDTIQNTDPTSLISKFGQGVNSILSIPIFGQLTLGTLVFIPLSMAVLLLLLKIWRRN